MDAGLSVLTLADWDKLVTILTVHIVKSSSADECGAFEKRHARTGSALLQKPQKQGIVTYTFT